MSPKLVALVSMATVYVTLLLVEDPGSGAVHDVVVGKLLEPLTVVQFFVIAIFGDCTIIGSVTVEQLHFEGDPGIAAVSYGKCGPGETH